MSYYRHYPAALASILLLAGCHQTLPTDSGSSPSASISEAYQPRIKRPAEDHLRAMAIRVPSFTGYDVREGRTIALTADQADVTAVQEELRSHLRRTDPARAAGSVEVRVVDFPFLLLAEWRDIAFDHVLAQEGVWWLDLDESSNRVAIGVGDSVDRRAIAARLESLGVSMGAISFHSAAEPVADTTLRLYNRPVRGGFAITTTDQFGARASGCSAGFNAKSGANNLILTNSHCTAEMWDGDNGGIYQDTIQAGRFLGYEFSDPEWEDCAWWGTKPCRYSDAAAFKYEGGVSFDYGYIGRPMAPPGTTGFGSVVIDSSAPRFEIVAKADPNTWDDVDQVGRTSGWTRGDMHSTCVDRTLTGDDQVDGHDAVVLCQAQALYRAGGGDSGSPVFRINTGITVTLLGIHWGRDTVPNPDIAIFSPMSGIQLDLGTLGVTDSPPPLTASIEGPNYVQSGYPCHWYADISGGTGTYNITWSGVLSGSGATLDGSVYSTGALYLTVTSGTQSTGDDQYITVSMEAPPCGI